MTERSPSAPAHAHGFDRRGALKSVRLSLPINAFCPFLLYRVLQSHFPANSVMALLMRRSFPSSGLILSLVRKRTVDLSGIVKDASRRAKNDAFRTPRKLRANV